MTELNIDNNKITASIYSVSYESGAGNKHTEWVVKGPGTYIRMGDDRNYAYEMASRLNNAYILGYTAYHMTKNDTKCTQTLFHN